MDIKERALLAHEQWHGKLEIVNRCPINSYEDMTIAYTPGRRRALPEDQRGPRPVVQVHRPRQPGRRRHRRHGGPRPGRHRPRSRHARHGRQVRALQGLCQRRRHSLCASAPRTWTRSSAPSSCSPAPSAASTWRTSRLPRCIEIERRLKDRNATFPVFHDDQHGTAIVVCAALINACKLTGKAIPSLRIVINGAGAAALAIARLLLSLGVSDLTLCDRFGLLYDGNPDMNPEQARVAALTNPRGLRGVLRDAMPGADVFIGVSAPNCLTREDVALMADKAVVFAMANPVPEIWPDEAKAGGAFIVGTGRSDFPNQINNVLAFPGVFRGALDVRASDINEEMKLAAAHAIADLVTPDKLSPENIMPPAFDREGHRKVAEAVRRAARESGVARI